VNTAGKIMCENVYLIHGVSSSQAHALILLLAMIPPTSRHFNNPLLSTRTKTRPLYQHTMAL
jgi:hypothetical protein